MNQEEFNKITSILQEEKSLEIKKLKKETLLAFSKLLLEKQKSLTNDLESREEIRINCEETNKIFDQYSKLIDHLKSINISKTNEITDLRTILNIYSPKYKLYKNLFYWTLSILLLSSIFQIINLL